MISKAEYDLLKAQNDAYEKAREQFDPKRFKRGGGYDAADQKKILQIAGLSKEITNEERSKIELYEFVHDPPEKYFAYYDKPLTKISNWMGVKLGDIISKSGVYEVGFRMVTGRRGRAVNVRIKGINGVTYAGTCYLDAGDYCRMKALKGQIKKNPHAIFNPRGGKQLECCVKLGPGGSCENCGKHTHFSVEWLLPSRAGDDMRTACSSRCALVLKKKGPGPAVRNNIFVFNNPGNAQRVLAENFVKGANSGVASSLYIHGNRIYSYGPHFPIAERTVLSMPPHLAGQTVITVTVRKAPSKTTAAQINLVLAAAQDAGLSVDRMELQPEAKGPAAYSNPAAVRKNIFTFNNPVRFKDLGIGETFVFASQEDPRFLTSGMARGPWVKNSQRTYEHVDDVGKPIAARRYGGGRISVGSVNVEVIRTRRSGEIEKSCSLCGATYIGTPQMHKFECSAQGGKLYKENPHAIFNPRDNQVEQAARAVGLYVATWSPGDGVTRYRFFTKTTPGSSYADYHQGDGIYTALGRKDAMAFISAYGQGRSARTNPSRAAQKFISSEIGHLRRKGYEPKRAAAAAYSMARKKGYRVNPSQVVKLFQVPRGLEAKVASMLRNAFIWAQARDGAVLTMARPDIVKRAIDYVRSGKPLNNPLLQTVFAANPPTTAAALKRHMVSSLKKEFRGLVDNIDGPDAEFEIEGAIYWFANDYHGGGSSLLYQILSTSKFRPGPSVSGPEDEIEQMMYDSLVQKYSRANPYIVIDRPSGRVSSVERGKDLGAAARAYEFAADVSAYMGRPQDVRKISRATKIRTGDFIRRPAGVNPLTRKESAREIREIRRSMSKAADMQRMGQDPNWMFGHAHGVAGVVGRRGTKVAQQLAERAVRSPRYNPLTRKETADVLRASRAELAASEWASQRYARTHRMGKAMAYADVAAQYGPKSSRQHAAIQRAKGAIFPRTNPPAGVRLPKPGTKMTVAEALDLAQRIGDRALIAQCQQAMKLQKKANKGAKCVIWKTFAMGSKNKIDSIVALTHYGDSPETMYKPPKGSKKGNHMYRHKWGEKGGKPSVPLLASADGKMLLMPLEGKKVASDWLRH